MMVESKRKVGEICEIVRAQHKKCICDGYDDSDFCHVCKR